MKDELACVYAALMPANQLVCQVSEVTGLRVGDVLALRTEQLGKGQRLTVHESKTGKSKRVYLPKDLYADLKAQAGGTWVFESPRDPDKHRTRQAVWADVKRAVKAFRLPQNVTPHSWRKYYAVDLFESNGGDLAKVANALNHAPEHPEVTMIYVMAAELYRAKYDKRKRRARA